MSLNYRENVLLKVNSSDTTRPDFAGSYTVTAYPVGAVASAGSSGATITVDRGHSFVPGDKFLLRPGSSNLYSADVVLSVTATTIVMTSSFSVSAGDALVNLGPDTGSTSPAYDGSPLKIYSDADGSTVISNSRVTASSSGEYTYYYLGDGRYWELIRNGSGTVVDAVKGHGGIRGRYNVQDYGASGDGSTNDTLRVRAALLTVPSVGGDIYFPAGTYIVKPTAANLGTLGIGGTYRRIYGDGKGRSVIKVGDSALSYNNLLAGDHTSLNPSTDLTGLEVFDLTLDHNIANNAIASDPITGSNRQRSIAVFAGTDVTVRNVEIINASCVNSIDVNGTTCKRARILNCTWRSFGAAGVVHDSSVIYLALENTSSQAIVQGCMFEGYQVNGNGNRTAIEVHSSQIVVANNNILNFAIGMFITGVQATEDTKGLVVTGNTIRGACHGIKLVSAALSAHTSGYGIDGAIIANNVIHLEQTSTWSVFSAQLFGIVITGSSDLDVRAVSISNNVIVSVLETTNINSDADSFAIGWYDASGTKVWEDSAISNNIVTNFPMIGIRLGVNLKNVRVNGNSLINCSSTEDSAPPSVRPNILVSPSASLAGLNISNNYLADTQATPNVPRFIQCATGAFTGTFFHIYGNRYVGVPTTSHIILDGTNSGAPHIDEVIDSPVSLASAINCDVTSRIVDPTNNIVYRLNNERTAWRQAESVGRIANRQPTVHVAGDWVLANWGTSPSIAPGANDNDQRGTITITSGTGAPTNANTATLTFKDGAFPTAPIAVVSFGNGSTGVVLARILTVTTSTTAMAIRYDPGGTAPGTSVTFVINYLLLG